MIDENLQLVILNNTGKEKSDDEVAVLNLAMSDLVEKLEEARDEKLNINHSFSSLHPAPFPSVQFQLTMTRAERNEERKVGVRKMYPVKVVSINFKFFLYRNVAAGSQVSGDLLHHPHQVFPVCLGVVGSHQSSGLQM